MTRLHFHPIPERQRAKEARRIAPKGERIRAENAHIDATNRALADELGGFEQLRRAKWGDT